MDKNNNTKHFIIGLLSGLLFIPVIEELLNVIMAWIQVLLLKPNKIVLKGNKELSELQGNDADSPPPTCVGFQIPHTDAEYYEDDDDHYTSHIPKEIFNICSKSKKLSLR